MKKSFIIPFMLALSISSGCNADQSNDTQTKTTVKKTLSVKCYSGTIITYEHNNIVLFYDILETHISARIKEVDTGIIRRVPISQCYFKNN